MRVIVVAAVVSALLAVAQGNPAPVAENVARHGYEPPHHQPPPPPSHHKSPPRPPSKGKSGPSSCSKSEFWYGTRSCCLPHGGPPGHKPSPPPGNECPSTHYWNHGQGCCTPYHPNPPPKPTCPKNWDWITSRQCCEKHTQPPPPPSKPSHKAPAPPPKHHNPPPPPKHNPPPPPKHHNPPPPPVHHKPPPPPPVHHNGGHHKRSADEQWDMSFCPASLQTCPVMKAGNEIDRECVDITSEAWSCGGCTSVGEGQDCSKIPNALNSACMGGSCVVEKCQPGFKVSADSGSCEQI